MQFDSDPRTCFGAGWEINHSGHACIARFYAGDFQDGAEADGAPQKNGCFRGFGECLTGGGLALDGNVNGEQNALAAPTVGCLVWAGGKKTHPRSPYARKNQQRAMRNECNRVTMMRKIGNL